MITPDRKIRKAVAAIIHSHGKYLLAQRVKMLTKDRVLVPTVPEWDLVKGGMEFGESSKEAILRELYEETGSKAYTIIKQFPETIDFDFPVHLREKIGFDAQQTTVFLVDFKADIETLQSHDNEIGSYIFVTKEELLQRIILPETQTFIGKHLREI